MKFFKNRNNLIAAGVVVLFILGGVWYSLQRSATDVSAETPEIQTAKVRTGDLIVTASGAGTVLPAAEVELAFRSSGVVTELNVAVGDKVSNQQVMARLEENIQAEADFMALFSPLGIAQAEAQLQRQRSQWMI